MRYAVCLFAFLSSVSVAAEHYEIRDAVLENGKVVTGSFDFEPREGGFAFPYHSGVAHNWDILVSDGFRYTEENSYYLSTDAALTWFDVSVDRWLSLMVQRDLTGSPGVTLAWSEPGDVWPLIVEPDHNYASGEGPRSTFTTFISGELVDMWTVAGPILPIPENSTAFALIVGLGALATCKLRCNNWYK